MKQETIDQMLKALKEAEMALEDLRVIAAQWYPKEYQRCNKVKLIVSEAIRAAKQV